MPQKHQSRRRELADRDAEEEVREAPDHAHRGEQQKTAPGHCELELSASRGASIFAIWPARRTWLDWRDNNFYPPVMGGTDKKRGLPIPRRALFRLYTGAARVPATPGKPASHR